MIKILALAAFLVGVVLGAPQVRGPTLDGRIVGGWNTTIEEHPYQVSLELFNSHLCGGVIISSNWVLTAGHCIIVNTASLYSIRTESTIRNSGGSVYAVASIVIHEDYAGSPVPDFDVAALLVSTPIQFSAGAQPIGIVPYGSGPVAGLEAVITGWGDLVQGGASSIVLQEVRVPTVSQGICGSIYGSLLNDNMFCAGLLGEGGKDACQGDSGGPVVINGLVAGLVSWGSGCAQPDFPGVKTNLFQLRQWILDKTGV